MPEDSNFDIVSPYYDRLVRLVFGKSMFRAQSVFLDRIPNDSSVLVLGGGTGLWLNDLQRLNPHCKIVYIDSSRRMIEQAGKNLIDNEAIDFRVGNENSMNDKDHFDTVITYCYFDLFTDDQLQEVISKIRKSTKRNCQWIVVDFVSTSWWQSAMLFLMYIFFKFTAGLQTRELPQWERVLKQNNIISIEQKLFYKGFIKSSIFLDKAS